MKVFKIQAGKEPIDTNELSRVRKLVIKLMEQENVKPVMAQLLFVNMIEMIQTQLEKDGMIDNDCDCETCTIERNNKNEIN